MSGPDRDKVFAWHTGIHVGASNPCAIMGAKTDHIGTILFSHTVHRPVRVAGFMILKRVRQEETSVLPFECDTITRRANIWFVIVLGCV